MRCPGLHHDRRHCATWIHETNGGLSGDEPARTDREPTTAGCVPGPIDNCVAMDLAPFDLVPTLNNSK
jgi:hypothetical protein